MDMSPLASRIFSSLLEEHTGQILSIGRRWRIETALKPVMRKREMGSLDMLANRLQAAVDPLLAGEVIDALLNNETYFYREAAAFELLAAAIVHLAEARPERRLRIWCAGCSTGQEAYSLAMMFAEDGERWDDWTIDIVGTDVSRAAIAQAREGLFSQFEIQRGLPVSRMMQWFKPEADNWRASPELRGMLRFQAHNLLDPPPSPLRFDVVLCRNVLLYFGQDMSRQVFDRLAGAIAPDGMLMLGAGETVIGQTTRFLTDQQFRGLYRPR